MNSVEKDRKTLQDREKTLLKLSDDQKELKGKIDTLQGDRSAAVRDLAAIADESRASPLRKRISDIEGKLSPLLLRMEGLEKLIEEAGGELEKARIALKEAEEETKTRLQAFIKGKENEQWNNFVNSLPERRKEFFRLYLLLCSLVSEAQIDGTFFDSDGNTHRSPELEGFLVNLASLNEGNWKAAGFRRFPWTGGVDRVHVIPLFAQEEGVNQRGSIDAVDVAQIRRKKRIADLEAEFQKTENGR